MGQNCIKLTSGSYPTAAGSQIQHCQAVSTGPGWIHSPFPSYHCIPWLVCLKFPLKPASNAWPPPITKPPAQAWEAQQFPEAPDSLQACRGTGPGKKSQLAHVQKSQAARSQETGPCTTHAKATQGFCTANPDLSWGEAVMPGAVHSSEVCLRENSHYKLAVLILMLWSWIHILSHR